MFFSKPKPTVTPIDKEWIENAFLWFEEQYGEAFMKSVEIIEPTKKFFNCNFKGSEETAEFILKQLSIYMDIKGVNIELYYFSEHSIDFDDKGVISTENPTIMGGGHDKSAIGKYHEVNPNNYKIGLNVSQLNDPISMIATLSHELSHLILLGEGRIDENNEELTDLNCIALGLGIFTSNSIFQFSQWQDFSHQGWQSSRNGYIPEEIAAYALAIFSKYQDKNSNWERFLNKSMSRLYRKNIKYLESTSDEIMFK